MCPILDRYGVIGIF